MPFLYRYAAVKESQEDLDSDFQGTAQFEFFTGNKNDDADFTALKFLRLHPDSQPMLPLGTSVDDAVGEGSSKDRYDIRVVVVVQDPSSNSDNAQDVYWTKVVFGHTNIMTDTQEYKGDGVGPFDDATSALYTGTQNGFTYRGLIPLSTDGSYPTAKIPDAPGVIIQFPSPNMLIDDGHYKIFEILIKLPTCTVTSLITGTEFKDVDGVTDLQPVSANVENVECANRGKCNRQTGACECFTGFYGSSCSRQTVLV